jgi:hypothetical protein
VVATVQSIAPSASVQSLRRIFAFPVMLGCLLATLAVMTVRLRFDDPDMWWHLALGKATWTTHSLPTKDMFSYTTGHHAYVPHEWLAQLFIYGAYRFGGYSGLMLWLCFFASAIFVAGYIFCWLYSRNAKVAFLGGVAIWLFSTVGLAIRPQMIGYSFLIVELLLLHLGETKNPRWFLALPPLFVIWVNSHGSFFLGLALAGVALFSSFFQFRAGLLTSSRWDPRRQKILAGAIALSFAALFLNPVGLDQILYPVMTMFHPSIGLSEVQEWQALQFEDVRAFALVGTLVCIFLAVIVRRTELLWRELIWLALGTWLAASHRRLLFVFGILAAPVLSRLLSTAWEGYDAEHDRPVPNAILIAASLLTIFLAFPRPMLLEKQVEEHSPVKAVKFIKSAHISGNMLNDWVYGGYLLWAAPEHPVFIDGRGDVFEETGVLQDFGDWATLRSDPNELLKKYRIDFCVLARQSPMVKVLSLLNWKIVYSDNNSVVVAQNGNPN